MEIVSPRQDQKPVKISGIVGSPHKNGMTYHLVQQALAGARAAGADVQIIFLADEDRKPCLGCGGPCWETLECVHEAAPAYQSSLQEADGLVFGVPVYCWQMNGLTHLFIDKMRWNTGSVLKPRNRRAAFGIACAGGSGTGCVLALQALYRYFYNWAFHGLPPLPVTRFNYQEALKEAYAGGEALVGLIRKGLRPFPNLGEAMADLEALPFMMAGPLDELRLIVQQLLAGLPVSEDLKEPAEPAEPVEPGQLAKPGEPLVQMLHAQAQLAEEAFAGGDRQSAAAHFSKAYEAGSKAWNKRKPRKI